MLRCSRPYVAPQLCGKRWDKPLFARQKLLDFMPVPEQGQIERLWEFQRRSA
jgi:hypothetical protein